MQQHQPFDQQKFKTMVHELQPTQEAIGRAAKYALEHPVAGSLIFELMVDEASEMSSQRLTIFYLFNEIIQVSARKRLVTFLEAGAAVFIPNFSSFILRLAAAERKPYLRTLDIWRERSVYSANFLTKLSEDWKSGKSEAALSTSPRKRKRTTVETIQAVEAVTAAAEAEKENDSRMKTLNEKIDAIFHGKDVPLAPEQLPHLLHELKQMEEVLTKELQLVASAILKLSQLKS